MDRIATQDAIKAILSELRRRLEEATGLARAAEVCAHADNVNKSIDVALDIEQLAYEAGRLLDAASLLNRLSKE